MTINLSLDVNGVVRSTTGYEEAGEELYTNSTIEYGARAGMQFDYAKA